MCWCDEEKELRKKVEGEGILRKMGSKLGLNYREFGILC